MNKTRNKFSTEVLAGAGGFGSREGAHLAPGGGDLDCQQIWLFDPQSDEVGEEG